MYLVFQSEMLHRREHSARRIENLCNGRYQPVSTSVPSWGYQLHIDLLAGELELGTAEPEFLYGVNKQQEMWDIKM